jgi:hypothetical protein
MSPRVVEIVTNGRWIKVSQQADLWLSLCHADDGAPVAQVRLICCQHKVDGRCHGWGEEARLVGASQAACAQDCGAVGMHALAGMFVRCASA